jgi:hypothetical protein
LRAAMQPALMFVFVRGERARHHGGRVTLHPAARRVRVSAAPARRALLFKRDDYF